jgi:hypothetical protein
MGERILIAMTLVFMLSACGGEEPATPPEKTFGGRLGDSYKGMLDDTRQGVDLINGQMQRTEQAVRER